MIDGIGIDVVDIARFEESLVRTPALKERIFTSREAQLKISSLAARFAAKEALAKALLSLAHLKWSSCRYNETYVFDQFKNSVKKYIDQILAM